MSKYEFVGETPLLLAGVALGDGVDVERGPNVPEEFAEQEDGQSPYLFPGDHLILPDDHEVIHGLLVGEDKKHAGEKPKRSRKKPTETPDASETDGE